MLATGLGSAQNRSHEPTVSSGIQALPYKACSQDGPEVFSTSALPDLH